jgi:hypothetical protein
VEIRLRMGPRCTVVARTFSGVWCKYEYRIGTAMMASRIQIHRRLDGVFELFVNAN